VQGETPLLPDVIDPHNIRRQQFLMLWWVLLCDYCSFYYQLPKTSELGRATNAHIPVAAHFRDYYHGFRVCSFAELSSAFIIPPPRALQLSTPTLPTFFFRVTSHEHGACPPRLYTLVYCYAPCRRLGTTGSFLLQRIALHGLILALPYNTILRKRNIDGFRLYVLLLPSSIRGHLLSLKFRPHRVTRTPHRQHRTGFIHGTRLMSQHCKRVKKLYQMIKNLKGALHNLSAHAYARNSIVQSAHMCKRCGCWAKNPRAC
jgi:hypothetical protein